MRITVDRNRRFQTMRGFGMSGAWWAQCVGGWTAADADGVPVRDRISALLYSKTQGIGLDVYRYNLGGGSAGSGRGIYSDPWRRAESFDTPAGPDYTKDAAAVYMMRQAVKDGAAEVVMFVNSPIERLTVNGLAHTDKRRTGRTNIKKKNIPAFADYCLDAAEHFIAQGVPVAYISPVNEPLWVWNGGQEGCHYLPRRCAYVLRTFAQKMAQRPALAGVKLAGPENGDIRWLNKSYTRALMKYPEVRAVTDGVDLHSYFLKDDLPFLGNRPAWLRRYRRWLDKTYPGLDVRVSEWCHMQGGRDAGMDSALAQAKVMLEDLTLLNASSFQGWIACSPYDYCDGLIYIDPDTETYSLTKRYYAFGNFSRYIPAGAVRVAAAADDADVKAAAFVTDDATVLILTNPAAAQKEWQADAHGTLVTTDDAHDLAETPFVAGMTVLLPPRSVNTVILPLAKM